MMARSPHKTVAQSLSCARCAQTKMDQLLTWVSVALVKASETLSGKASYVDYTLSVDKTGTAGDWKTEQETDADL